MLTLLALAALLPASSPVLDAAPVAREVQFAGAGGVMLSGTILAPSGVRGKAPAVLLLPGSGPTDRDGNQRPLLATDLLKQIAERLAADGLVTLRFDKRATQRYAKVWPKDVPSQNRFFSWENFVGDAALALKYLRLQSDVDPVRTAILGHSEGAMIALQLGADPQTAPAAMALVGAPGRGFRSIIRQQIADLLTRQQVSDAIRTQYLGILDKAIDHVTSKGTAPEGLPVGLQPLFPPSAVSLLQSYFKLDPAALAGKYEGQVLVLNGENDSQISATADAPILDKAYGSRSKGTHKLATIAKASHNLKAAATKDEPGIAGPVLPAALTAIADWLKAAMPPKG